MSELEQALLEMHRRSLPPERIAKVLSDPLLLQEASAKLSEVLAQLCTLALTITLDPGAAEKDTPPASFIPSMTLPAEFSTYLLNAAKTLEVTDENSR